MQLGSQIGASYLKGHINSIIGELKKKNPVFRATEKDGMWYRLDQQLRPQFVNSSVQDVSFTQLYATFNFL